jgi:hypothetical protein
MPLNKKASQLSLQGFVARTRLFSMISIAFDLPKSLRIRFAFARLFCFAAFASKLACRSTKKPRSYRCKAL